MQQTLKASLGTNTHHTIVMTHGQVKLQMIHLPTGMACGVKSITGINKYSITIVNLLASIEVTIN